jgi:hypothetical protein
MALKISLDTILRMHQFSRGSVWDAGKLKEKPGDIIEKYPDGRVRVRFKTVSPDLVPSFVQELVFFWSRCLEENAVHPLVTLAGFNLDFLCIHPFRDGNGRISRLLLLLQAYHLGYDVGRYISLELLIEQNKERYYETLELSSQGWHEGNHDPWPYIGYLLFILKSAYREFEGRLGEIKSPRGAKTQLIEAGRQQLPRAILTRPVAGCLPGSQSGYDPHCIGKSEGKGTCGVRRARTRRQVAERRYYLG